MDVTDHKGYLENSVKSVHMPNWIIAQKINTLQTYGQMEKDALKIGLNVNERKTTW